PTLTTDIYTPSLHDALPISYLLHQVELLVELFLYQNYLFQLHHILLLLALLLKFLRRKHFLHQLKLKPDNLFYYLTQKNVFLYFHFGLLFEQMEYLGTNSPSISSTESSNPPGFPLTSITKPSIPSFSNLESSCSKSKYVSSEKLVISMYPVGFPSTSFVDA